MGNNKNNILFKVAIKLLRLCTRVIMILLGLSALVFQLVNLVFGTLSKSSLNKSSELQYYMEEFIPHMFTIIICIWFIIYQINYIRKW